MPAKPSELSDDPQMWPPHYRWLLFALRATIIVLCAWIAGQLPLPILDQWLPVKNVVITGVAVILTGKSLYDTLFFDRYWP